MKQRGQRGTFHTPYDQYQMREGQGFVVLEVVTEPTEDIDEDCLPMYRIQFDDGFRSCAWPEEVEGS